MGITHFRVYASCGHCGASVSRDKSCRATPEQFAAWIESQRGLKYPKALPKACRRCYTEGGWQAICFTKISYSADVEILLHVRAGRRRWRTARTAATGTNWRTIQRW
jgi:hypothetical protein